MTTMISEQRCSPCKTRARAQSQRETAPPRRAVAAAPRGSGSAGPSLAVVVIGGWQWFTDRRLGGQVLLRPAVRIWDSLVHLFTEGTAFGTIWENLWVTVQEAFLGFLLGTLAGVVFGILLGSNRYLVDVFSPYIRIVNSIPRIVLGSIFIVAFGLGVFPKVLLAAVLVFFVVFFNAFQGVREVDQNLVANVRVLGASPLQVARHVTIPSAMTWIIASLHTAFGFAIIGALVAEVLGAQHGHRPDHQPGAGHLRPEHGLRLHGDHRGRHPRRRVPHHPARAARCSSGGRRAAPRPRRSDRSPLSLPRTRPPNPRHYERKAHHDEERNIDAVARRRSAGAEPRGLRRQLASGTSGRRRRLRDAASMPTVKMMVGGIDKQIYLPYQLAQSLGYYKKYGVNVELSTEQKAASAPRTRWHPGRWTNQKMRHWFAEHVS